MKAKAEQEKAFEIAAVQPQLDAVMSLTERLRTEKGIITSVTKELS